jgi:hypothetical protein
VFCDVGRRHRYVAAKAVASETQDDNQQDQNSGGNSERFHPTWRA